MSCSIQPDQLSRQSEPDLLISTAKFSDSSDFDSELSSKLKANPLHLTISFDPPVNANALPERIDAWLSRIRARGGRITMKKEMPEKNQMSTRVIVPLAAALGALVYAYVRDEYLYSPVDSYNANVMFNPLSGNVQRIVLVNQDEGAWEKEISLTEQTWEKDYEDYYGNDRGSVSLSKPSDITAVLERLHKKSGQSATLIYLKPTPKQLEILLLIPGQAPVYRGVPAAAQEHLIPVVESFSRAVSQPTMDGNNDTAYLADAQQLYDWIIAPIESELSASNTDILLFCMGAGLRTLPLAALHDGKRFLIERYNPVRIPAFNLIKTRYNQRDEKTPVAALGASSFASLPELPAVAIELETIANNTSDAVRLNETFTLASLQRVLENQQYPIVHLASHALFLPGKPQDSYIALWQEKLDIDRLGKLPWQNGGVELLVLSACQTALGDKQTELGFAGLAFQTGVDTVIASLWSVSDAGTLALMSEFYYRLRHDPGTKAEALRQAQLALLNETVRIEESELRGLQGERGIHIPQTVMTGNSLSFSHPFFWAAFTVVGSPW